MTDTGAAASVEDLKDEVETMGLTPKPEDEINGQSEVRP